MSRVTDEATVQRLNRLRAGLTNRVHGRLPRGC